MFDKLKKLLGKEETKVEAPKKEKKPRQPKEKKELSEKEKATLAGEPYVAIVKVDVDPNNIHEGAFELDWNDKFLANLIRAGYKMKPTDTDNDVVDRWFQTVCRNVALEIYDQKAADLTNRDLRQVNTKDLGNGRTEVS